jgi:hypothetical protein
MSGGGIATDNQGSMFFATGNGYASQLNGIPVNGRDPPTALEEAAVHMAINDDGSLTVVDFFMPWEKVQLDGADKGEFLLPRRNAYCLLEQIWGHPPWNFCPASFSAETSRAWAS